VRGTQKIRDSSRMKVTISATSIIQANLDKESRKGQKDPKKKRVKEGVVGGYPLRWSEKGLRSHLRTHILFPERWGAAKNTHNNKNHE